MLERIIQYSSHHKIIVLLFMAKIVGLDLYSHANISIDVVSGKTGGGKFNRGQGATNKGFTQILNASDFKPNTEFLTKGVYNLITE